MRISSTVIEGLVKNGLPAWIYTWRTVLVIAIVGPFAVMMLSSGLASVWALVFGQPTHAPACYTMQYADPLPPGARPFLLDNEDVAKVQTEHDQSLEAAVKAINACQPGACDGKQSAEYRRSVINYMSIRGWAAQKMFVRYGDAGLSHATLVYDTARDVAVVNAVRKGFAAGLLDLSRLRSNEAAVRMLLFRPLAEFKLCTAQ